MNTLIRFTLTALLVLLATSFTHAGDKITYYHNDALGSPVAATNQLGQVIWRETYKPHGQRTTNAAASVNNKVWFTGKQEESALGINYFGARWYHPEVGRFLVIDPVGVSPDNIHSFNRYGYANNNPYTYIDPTGGIVETAWDALNIGLGAVSFVSNVQQGNYGSAALDAGGIVVDGAAAAFPFVPGGVGSALKASRAADDAVDAAKASRRAGDFTKAQKKAAKAENAAQNGGSMACQDCGKAVENIASQKNVPTPGNQAHVHHDPAIKDGGGKDSKAVVLCPPCHIKRHANE